MLNVDARLAKDDKVGPARLARATRWWRYIIGGFT